MSIDTSLIPGERSSQETLFYHPAPRNRFTHTPFTFTGPVGYTFKAGAFHAGHSADGRTFVEKVFCCATTWGEVFNTVVPYLGVDDCVCLTRVSKSLHDLFKNRAQVPSPHFSRIGAALKDARRMLDYCDMENNPDSPTPHRAQPTVDLFAPVSLEWVCQQFHEFHLQNPHFPVGARWLRSHLTEHLLCNTLSFVKTWLEVAATGQGSQVCRGERLLYLRGSIGISLSISS